jgi:ubiquinone/menaquinone biosynthesis C-methylase UbiE
MEMVYYPYPKAPFLVPEQVVEELELQPGDKVLDFGAGAGYWALPIAQSVGGSGHVYVTDAKPENLAVIKVKAQKLGLDNLTYFHASYNCSLMPIQTKVDMIVCSNILSLVKDRDKLMSNFKKLAKSGSRLVIIDWNDKSSLGPEKANRIDPEEIILTATKMGFEFKKLLSAGAHHTGLLFVYEK